MKIIILISVLAISMVSFGFIGLDKTITQQVINTTESVCHYGQCYATAKSTGNRCKHCVSNQGDMYCWQHK